MVAGIKPVVLDKWEIEYRNFSKPTLFVEQHALPYASLLLLVCSKKNFRFHFFLGESREIKFVSQTFEK